MAHYFDEDPEAPSDPRRIDVTVGSISFSLDTDAGVFSHGRLDSATALLLNAAPPPPATGDLLDLGCGAGPIALVMAHQSPDATIWAVDVNRRARDLTASNAERLGLTNVKVCTPEEVPESLRFAAIRSNPPVRIGKHEMRSLLTVWLHRLEPDGVAHLVASKHLGADSLSSWLTDRGHAVERITSRRGFRVLSVGGRPAP
ncbi:MAG: class I SAM-dependent methyltransferase [Ilumatobacteraceae bacterium]